MADMLLRCGDFATTTITVEPASEAGRAYMTQRWGIAGVCPTSVELRKSVADPLLYEIRKHGLRVDVI